MARSGFGRESIGSLATGAAKTLVGAAGPIFTLIPTAKYLTGARTVIKINGQPVVFAFQVSWNVITENTEILTIDDYLPHELAPQRIIVNGTIGGFIIPGQSPSSEVIQSNVLSFLFNKYVTIEVTDSQTGATIFRASSAVITSSSGSSTAEQPATMTLQFKAIGWQNEFKPEMPVPWSGSNDKSPVGGNSPIGKAIDTIKKLF